MKTNSNAPNGASNGADTSDAAATPPAPLVFADAASIWERNAAYLGDGSIDRFTAGGGAGFSGLYDRDLAGVPFVICSAPIFRTQEGGFGPQRVAQLWVQIVDAAAGELHPPRLVTLSGRYVVNRLQRMSERELVGSVIWTLARNPEWDAMGHTMDVIENGRVRKISRHPLGLAIYDPTRDRPEIVEGELNEMPDTTNASGAGTFPTERDTADERAARIALFTASGAFPTERDTAGTPAARMPGVAERYPAIASAANAAYEDRRAEIDAAGGPVPPWQTGLRS